MKYLFLLLILLFSGTILLIGQMPYVPFPTSEDAPVWHETDALKTCLLGDTTINNLNYSILWNRNCSEHALFDEPEYAIRETDKKVYLYDFVLDRETKLYDFNFDEIGDTVHTADKMQNYKIQLLDTSYVEMSNGTLRKNYFIAYLFNDFEYGHTSYWIEGIGDILGVIYEEMYFDFPTEPLNTFYHGETNALHQVICMKQDSTPIYQLDPLIFCDSTIVTFTSIESVLDTKNPVMRNNNGTIYFENITNDSDIFVSNINGQIFYQSKAINQNNIPVYKYPKGLYIISVKQQNNTSIFKFLNF